ncbi:MAG: DUF2306 domain-containing protein [Hyphomonas sp.]
MTAAMRRRVWQVAWAAIVALSAYYLYRALKFRFFTPDQLGPTLLNKQLWYALHMLFALPVIAGAPLQFWPALRKARPALHRWLGRAYVFGASGAALTAIYLGATIDLEGSRLPIVLLGSLWLFFTLAAFSTALRKDYDAHRKFMTRSYGMALVLVWLRIMGDVPPDLMFFYIEDPGIRDTTLEWMSWVVPLLLIELVMTWWPLLTRKKAKPA